MEFNPPPYGAPNPAEQPEPPRLGRKGKKSSGSESGAPTTKKVVDRSKRFAVIFAVVAAVILGLVFLGGTAPSQYVVVAKVNVAAGTPVNVASMLDAVAVPEGLEQPGALVGKSKNEALALAKEKVDGSRATYPIVVRQQIHPELFNVELALREPLQRNERLMSIQATVANAVAGQIKPGDRVDVAASADSVAGVVLSDVEVVSVTVSENQYQAIADQQTGENKNTRPEELLPGDPVPGIYVVRVSSLDAPRLFAADAGADLTLIYRPEGADVLPAEPMTATGVICAESDALPVCRDQ